MATTIWIVTTCVPGDTEPCVPHVFTKEADAEAFLDNALRSEWDSAGVADDDGNDLPYPGNWREAMDAIVEQDSERSYGQWQLTSHVIG